MSKAGVPEQWQYSWTVPADHPALPGHFPGRPIVPGVVLLDQAVHQLTRILGQSPSHLKLNGVKFLSPVVPGETVLFLLQCKTAGSYQVSISVGERVAAKAGIVIVNGSAA